MIYDYDQSPKSFGTMMRVLKQSVQLLQSRSNWILHHGAKHKKIAPLFGFKLIKDIYFLFYIVIVLIF